MGTAANLKLYHDTLKIHALGGILSPGLCCQVPALVTNITKEPLRNK